eukprot:7170419-Heterocapsa_arctica.AAC.1
MIGPGRPPLLMGPGRPFDGSRRLLLGFQLWPVLPEARLAYILMHRRRQPLGMTSGVLAMDWRGCSGPYWSRMSRHCCQPGI